MALPRISIVTTSFNQKDYLEHTILSVLGQNYPNLEYIIIDGGSTDGSVDIIRKYEKQLAYWVSEKDAGMYDGIQKGFEKSTGEIMAWINSDDIFHPYAFFVMAELFTEFKGIEWIQGLPSVIDEKGRTVFVKNHRNWSKYDFLTGDYKHIQQESTFWRRELWNKAGGTLNTKLKLAGDFDLWLRFFDHAKLTCLNTIIGAYRVRSANQKSLEGLDAYDQEARALIEQRLQHLSATEQKDLAFLKKYKSSFSRLPLIRTKRYLQFKAVHDYPPEIWFDRKLQKFILSR